ncbi:formylglycine-generating enzyme family protein [Noviherbaspirillum suwonense]|jgi:formylglycine-generating enzyme required for sulfatase activity|uniref:Formylglycine-generating enzyme, required for sulfatase activity, contains SUMF1/FGE domain n=1 Tax=Noviherbaspirillum suwonense TaxID=1224511 RepID=A0ABY1PSF3_9BURK|nr:formylglycine-generating enzyme family protein [Noviherbaspirillum suwonense]SMP45538.1 Formylglycine-generating enzyme, required for sulfatase activity, contains SUMF1/FGE domain [Noviherbaspirillum suwonense]
MSAAARPGGVKPCCVPSANAALPQPRPAAGPRSPDALRGALLALPGGRFRMGADGIEGYAADGEGPSMALDVAPFRIAATTVTNRQFAEFVRATRHVTDAERLGTSFVFYLQVPEALRPSGRQAPSGLPWWLEIEHASWQRPEGPGSHIYARADHPVVHVSWHDAQAYCAWSGTRLPTEAEWEYAARGGLVDKRYAWGDELAPGGEAQCNIWQGEFPNAPAAGWLPGTVPVQAFGANGYGLHNVAGNVWEWCADWFSPDYFRDPAARDAAHAAPTGRRSMRGGSFLCHESYCNRYRVAARGSNTPASASSNCGFRVAGDAVER